MRIANCSRASRVGGGDRSPLPAGYPLGGSPLSRRGLTLIELLITITIIAVLAGMILGVASVAGETAREAHTRHVITRLHNLLVQHLDTYKTRRVKLRERVATLPGVEEAINLTFPATNPGAAAKRGAALAEARLYALREMLLMEIPDRWSDVLLTRVPVSPITTGWTNPLYLSQRTELANLYLRRYQGLVGRINSLSGNPNTGGEITRNEGAECLYMVITVACGDGEARTLFHESNIGDSDGDGAPEFLDGWGHPINFLRWAPGFDSEIQINANIFTGPNDSAWLAAASSDHDPFDVFRSEPKAFRLVPLIYSPGRDEDSGLVVGETTSSVEYLPWRKPVSFSVNPNPPSGKPYLIPQLTPFELAPVNDGLTVYFGTDNGTKTSTDNIHNHLLGQR